MSEKKKPNNLIEKNKISCATLQISRYGKKKSILPPKSRTANFIPGLNISSSSFVDPLRFSDGIALQWSAATSGSNASSKLFGLMPAYMQC